MNVATIRYTGDRPFFIAMIGTDRLVFNRHNGFVQQLPVEACEQVKNQWKRFFVIDQGAPRPFQTADQFVPSEPSSIEFSTPEVILAESREAEVKPAPTPVRTSPVALELPSGENPLPVSPRVWSLYTQKVRAREARRKEQESKMTPIQRKNSLKKRMERTAKLKRARDAKLARGCES